MIKVTIAACWDGRDYYPPDYVNRLHNMCRRHTSRPFDFVLFAGPDAEARRHEIHPDIKIVQTGLPYWWSGMNAFRADAPGVETDTLLYLDLDQVIIGSLDDILDLPYDLACMKDLPSGRCPKNKERNVNVSVTLIRNGAAAFVWDAYQAAGQPTWNPLHPPPRAPLRMAAQEIIDAHGGAEIIPEAWVCSYKYQVRKYGLPEDCRVVSFHGRPKPHEVADQFVKEHWR